MKVVNLSVSSRYIQRFGGFHDDEWVNHDRNHVKRKFYLLNSNEKQIAEVDIGGKPLPKSTLIGHLIAIAIGAL